MKNKVFYDKEQNMFFQVRGNNACNSLLCGGFCHYYNDSKTTTQTQVLSYSYVKKCLEVVMLNEMRKYGIHHDGIGWRVSEIQKEFLPEIEELIDILHKEFAFYKTLNKNQPYDFVLEAAGAIARRIGKL